MVIGKTISHYKILEKLGEGGMGMVYRVQDTRLLRQVALKFLPPDLLTDENNRSRFIQEAQTASSLNHPNICVIHDINEADSTHFIVMELVEGKTLREILEHRGCLPEKEVVDIAIKVCAALAAVHEKGIFHRDIKTDNIMISRQGYVKVMDFGLAKLATDVAETIAGWESKIGQRDKGKIPRKEYSTRVVLPSLSGLLGTVSYMSPEQAQGKAVDQRSDIFSLGVVLYELLTATLPFEGESNDTILSKIIADPPEPIKLKKRDIKPDLEQFVNRCLNKDIEKRYQNMSDMLSDLAKIEQQSFRSGKPGEIRPAMRRKPPIAVAFKAERRQMTAMFCGLISSSTHSDHLDPEELREVLPAYQEICEKVVVRFEGQIIARYPGNEMMVYFGYPHAHEDDAPRAVHAGLGIVEGMRRLSAPLEIEKGIRLAAHIAIHTGLVVRGEIDDITQQEKISIVGETPGIATQMLSLAEPNSLIISAATYRLVEGFFYCHDLGTHSLKGISQPISVYKVFHESIARSRFDRATATSLTPMVGRKQETNRLVECWNWAVEGKGNIVLLSGEAGIGKSRLLRTLKEHVAENRQAGFTEIQSSPYFKNSAFYPLINFLELEEFRFSLEDTPEEKISKLEGYLLQYGISLPEVVPLLASLLSLPLDERYPSLNLTPERQKQLTIATLLRLIMEKAAQQPLLLIFEDLHWLDPSTLELIEIAIEQVPENRILALMTFRLEFQSSWANQANISQIALHKLDRPEIRRLTKLVAGGRELPAEIVQEIETKTDGIPLFIEEMTKMFLNSKQLKKRKDRYELTKPFSQLTVPETLQNMLMARLDQLTPVKEVAQLGAAIGREFSYPLIQSVSELSDAVLQQKLNRLVKAEILEKRGVLPKSTFLFKHALMHDAAYHSLLKSKRLKYHQQIAQMLIDRFPETADNQPELLAYHFTEAGRDNQAIPYWIKAGERAMQNSAYLETINHLNKGLELISKSPKTPEYFPQELNIQINLGLTYMAVKGYSALEVETGFLRAKELCELLGETPAFISVLIGLFTVYMMRAENRKAYDYGKQIFDLAQNNPDFDLLVDAHYTVADPEFCMGELSSAKEHYEQGSHLYVIERHQSHAILYGQDPGIYYLTKGAWAFWMAGYPDQALQKIRAAHELAKNLTHIHSITYAPAFGSVIHMLRREPSEAKKLAEAAIALSTEHILPHFLYGASIIHGWTLVELAQDEEGLVKMNEGIAGYKAIGAGMYLTSFLVLLAEAYGTIGQYEEGLSVLDEALTQVETTEERFFEAELYRVKAILQMAISHKHQPEVQEYLQKSLEIARRQKAKSLELRTSVDLSRIWQQQGKKGRARKLLTEVNGWFTEGFDTLDLKNAQVLLDDL
jgi:TOMM system kinase/cyclase fusion protein